MGVVFQQQPVLSLQKTFTQSCWVANFHTLNLGIGIQGDHIFHIPEVKNVLFNFLLLFISAFVSDAIFALIWVDSNALGTTKNEKNKECVWCQSTQKVFVESCLWA